MAVGLIRPDAGEVFFQGQNITRVPVHKRAQMGLGYLAQEPSVFRFLSVEDNILSILETLPLAKEERMKRLSLLLDELHLSHLRKKKAISLSGGERRRLEITRALVTQPSLLLLDEPFANIDPLAVADVKHLIAILKQKKDQHPHHRPQRAGDFLDRRPQLSRSRRESVTFGNCR